MPQQLTKPPTVRRAAAVARPSEAIGVAQIVRSLDTGGQEVLCARLVERLNRERFRPLVISLQGGGWLTEALQEQGIPVICLEAPERWHPATISRLAAILRRERIRIAHCHNRKALLYGGLACEAVPGARLVYTKHGVSHWEGGPTALLGRYLTRRARAVVAVSNDIARGLLAGRWVAPGRLVTVLNGVDLQEFRPTRDRAAARVPLGLAVSSQVIGTVARLSPEKDQATLLRAFAVVARRVPAARLLVVGDGALRLQLQALAAELDIAERVRFVGERNDVAELLGAMDVFCLPSLTEGTSLTLLEAMAAGLPVVATAVGGTPEVVADGCSGLLTPPGEPGRLAESLLRVLEHPDLGDRMGGTGRSIVAARYSLRAMVERYSKLYEQVLL